MRGRLIVVEGLDGAGKETQSNLLVKKLNEMGKKAIKVSFPNYGSVQCGMVEKYLRGEYTNQYLFRDDTITFIKQVSMMYAMDRIGSFIEKDENGESLIEKLNQGIHLVCDRYTTSNILHQSAKIRDYEARKEFIKWVQYFEYKHLGLPKPDITMLLDIPLSLSLNSIRNRENKSVKGDIHETEQHLTDVYYNKIFLLKYCKWDRIDCAKQLDIHNQDGMLYGFRDIEEINNTIVENVVSKLNHIEDREYAYSYR